MKKKTFVLGASLLALLICCVLVAWHRHHAETDDGSMAANAVRAVVPRPVVPNEGAESSTARRYDSSAAAGYPVAVALLPPLPTVPNPPTKAEKRSRSERSRDRYYELLLAKQGRDEAKEAELLPRLTAAFGSDPDTLLGALACATDFCRVELRGPGRVDVSKHWKPNLETAVAPKGLKFFVLAGDDDGNTIASYYFGRHDSWTVPDFGALKLM